MADSTSNVNFVSAASLWPPRLVSEQSAWNEHIPFAGWIVEAAQPSVLVELGTHSGVSYFAFCESVLRLELATSCHAVDTWLGDEQSGYYGEEVYQAVLNLNSQYYDPFSRLLRTTFDEAVENFDDSSIDLLHIDGLHTYEAVRHDFETWLPKLSSHAVVLLHDTNERKAGFGVHDYFGELSSRYPTFEFPHEHGLGIVCVGPDQSKHVRDLVALGESPEGRQIQGIYKALGRRISAELSSSSLSEQLADRDRQLVRVSEELDRRQQDIRRLSNDEKLHQEEIERREQDLAKARDETVRLHTQLATAGLAAKQLRAEVETQRERAAAIENSTSWRLTAPLRFVADRVKALLRPGTRAPAQPALTIQRLHETFDEAEDSATRRRLQARYRSHKRPSETQVSIIMPTYNRATQITAAINSVRDQTHQNWELLIMDDGSADDTALVVAPYLTDPRVQYLPLPRGGVSRARNAGLNLASGSVVAFLDSDNEWDLGFLELMVAALDSADVDITYSGMRLVRDGSLVGFRGDEFIYEECLQGNYIDLNVVCHRRSITDDGARFDESLRRMVDWDYLLGITRTRTVQYEPFIGASYSFHSSTDQISIKEPHLYGKLVKTKHRLEPESDQVPDSQLAYEQISLAIAIGIAAPRSLRNQWGDYHYALGLAQALERQGHSVELVYFAEQVQGEPDVFISLRGLTGHEPPPGAVRVLWSISHPDLLSFDEIDGFDLVFSASLTWPEAMRWSGSNVVHSLPQATDRARFFPSSASDRTGGLLFVGNSRGTDRAMVTNAVEAGLPLTVYGQDWVGRIPSEYIAGEYLPNEELSLRYGAAGAVLNDHWDSMREYGIVSNRAFDVVAAGGRLISDHVPSLSNIFGDAVATASTIEELQARFGELEAEDRDRHEEAMWALRQHSLDNRAKSLLTHIQDFVLGTAAYAEANVGQSRCELCVVQRSASSPRSGAAELSPDSPTTAIAVRGESRKLRVALVPQPAGRAFTSSAYIRLVQPLTSEIDDITVDLLRVRSDDPDITPADVLGDIDALVVSRTAFRQTATAEAWMDACEERGVPVVLDTDDAFHLMDESHPEFDTYQEMLKAYAVILDRVAEVWCSTPGIVKSLIEEGTNAIVVPNSIDPRLWRQYRQSGASDVRDAAAGLELLYAGTMTHGPDFGLLLPVLDDLAREVQFRLTVVGVAEQMVSRPWLRRVQPGSNALYPRYARWLRDLGPSFDVGVAPLVNNEFNRLKSDIKLMEYLALGVAPLLSSIDGYSDSDVALPMMLCDGEEQWLDRLRRLAEDEEALSQSREEAHRQRDLMWRHRKASITGTTLANRVTALVDRTK